MKNYIVVAYYTENTMYEVEAKRLLQSLSDFDVPCNLEAVSDKGGWYANTNYKPQFLKQMLLKYPDKAIVYVDCDAEFLRYPDLFDEWSGNDEVEVGVYEFDKFVNYGHSKGIKEVLSGTIFLQNNSCVYQLIEEWIKECNANPTTWDQKSLEKVLADDFTNLPAEYCKIFDKMQFVENPVIVHYQASRKVRNKNQPLETL
jgi:hypothetical protein